MQLEGVYSVLPTPFTAPGMTGFAFPEILVKIVWLDRPGRVDDAADVFYRAVPLDRRG